MVAFRSFVAVLVTVLTLFGGAFRAQTFVRAEIAVQSAVDGTDQATLDTGRSAVQGRATRPSTPNTGDGVGPVFAATDGVLVRLVDARPPAATTSASDAPHRRRVRTHVEHMVFLI